ncbi:MAG: regulatory protein RecX [Deltaproteobacteria bacterium]|nr:regulatory protein RecX [Candidatus Zymogenaceae bacterium]
MASALRSLGMRAHSTAELKRKLLSKRMDPAVVSDVIGYLIDLGYLNDHDFTRQFVEYGFRRKLWGAFKVRASLMERGVSKEIVDEHLCGGVVDAWERQGAREFARKRVRNQPRRDEIFLKKLTTQLTGRGFAWDIVSEVIAEIKSGDIDEGSDNEGGGEKG